MDGRCGSGFEVIVALVVGQHKGAKGWWEEKREVSGRKDRVRSHSNSIGRFGPPRGHPLIQWRPWQGQCGARHS